MEEKTFDSIAKDTHDRESSSPTHLTAQVPKIETPPAHQPLSATSQPPRTPPPLSIKASHLVEIIDVSTPENPSRQTNIHGDHSSCTPGNLLRIKQLKKSWEDPLFTTANIAPGFSTQQVQPSLLDRKINEKMKTLSEHHRNIIQGFRRGLAFPTSLSDLVRFDFIFKALVDIDGFTLPLHSTVCERPPMMNLAGARNASIEA